MTRARAFWKRVRRIWIRAGIAATVVFVTWSLIAYRPSAAAREAAIGDAAVGVTQAVGDWLGAV